MPVPAFTGQPFANIKPAVTIANPAHEKDNDE